MPAEEPRSRSMVELEDGKDYLVDYYAFFGVDREALENADAQASEALLKSAHREKNLQYHPDRYTHLSPLLKMQAEQVHRSVERGYNILVDPSKRQAYNKHIAEWKGPISDNGFPIYDWEFQASLKRRHLTDKEIAAAKGLLADIIGYNPNTHQLLERLVEADKKGDPELQEALDRSLSSKEIFVGIEEKLRWEQAGVPEHPMAEEAPAGYIGQVQAEIEEVKAHIDDQASQLLLQAQQNQLLLTGPDGENQTQLAITDPELALQKIKGALLKSVTEAAVHLQQLAVEREAIFQHRLDLSIEYRPLQKKLRPRLILCIDSPKGMGWQAWRLDGTNVSEDNSVTKEQMAKITNQDEARAWVHRGWSFMILKVREGLNLHVQFREAIQRHFESYLDQEKSK